MASKDLRKLAIAMLRDLKRTGEKKDNNPLARRELMSQPGQVFIVFRNRFDEVIKATVLEEANKTVTQKVIDDAYEVYKKAITFSDAAIYKSIKQEWKKTSKLSDQQLDALINERVIQLKQVAQSLQAQNQNAEVFVITKFKTLVDKGNLALKTYLKQQYKTEFKKVGGAGLSKGDKFGQQIGHADTETGGVASSSLRLLSAERLINSGNLKKEDKQLLKNIVQTLKSNVELTISHEDVVDSNGNLKKEYIPVLTYQAAWTNQEQSNDTETGLIESFQRSLGDIATNKSSLSLAEKIASVIFYNVAGKPLRNKKTKGRKNKIEKSSSKGKEKQTFKKKSSVPVVKGSGIKAALLKTAKAKKRSSAGSELFSLAVLLNKQLPSTVRKNMGPPGLENVTGRFANSVRITDISKTSQGYPSIGYTYNKTPYQVFEVGMGRAGWATTERDPRKLIDRSIREIAANMAIGRFYTRRV